MVNSFTPGPWFVSGVRFRMNGGEWHNVNRFDEGAKRDENICCVGYDARTGVGLADARLIAAAPDLLEALEALVSHVAILPPAYDVPGSRLGNARAAIAKARDIAK